MKKGSISDFQFEPVLTGEVTGDIWTGYIDSKDVNQFLVNDSKLRQELENCLKEYEESVLKCRKNNKIQNSLDKNSNEYIEVIQKKDKLDNLISNLESAGNISSDIYVILLYRKYQTLRESNSRETRKMDYQDYKRIEKYQEMANKSSIYVTAYNVETKKYVISGIHTLETEKEFEKNLSYSNLKNLANKTFGKDVNIVAFLNIVGSNVMLDDFYTIMKDKNVADLAVRTILINYLMSKGVDSRVADKLYEDDQFFKETRKEYYELPSRTIPIQLQTECILNCMWYIDYEQLLMLYMVRGISSIENMPNAITPEDSEGFKTYFTMMKIMNSFLKNALKENSIRNSSKIQIKENGESKTIKVFEIKEAMKNYSGDIYLTPQIYELIVNALCLGNEVVWEDPQNLRDFEISEKDRMLIMSMASGNSKKLYDAEIINNGDLQKLYNEDVLSLQELEKFDIELEDFVTSEDLVNRYREYIKAMLTYQRDENSANKTNFDNATNLKNKAVVFYKKYTLDKMTESEKTENAENLILDYYAELDEQSEDDSILEALREMYKDRIVNFEAIKNSDETFLKSLLIDIMLKRGELTLSDTMKLKKTFSFDEQKKLVDEAFKDDEIDENQKFILVMNMFFENTKEDSEARYEFLQRFRFSGFNGKLDPQFANLGNDVFVPHFDNKKKSQNWQSYIYADNIKWLLFMNIDKDAMPTKYSNGYIEFYLPKFNARVIEKYYEIDYKTKKIKNQSYGVATYFIDDEEFRRKNNLLIGKDNLGENIINEKNLRKIVPKTDRVSHVTQSQDKNWMRTLVKKLGINLEYDTKYTENELEDLNNVIISFENNYERF